MQRGEICEAAFSPTFSATPFSFTFGATPKIFSATPKFPSDTPNPLHAPVRMQNSLYRLFCPDLYFNDNYSGLIYLTGGNDNVGGLVPLPDGPHACLQAHISASSTSSDKII